MDAIAAATSLAGRRLTPILLIGALYRVAYMFANIRPNGIILMPTVLGNYHVLRQLALYCALA